MARKKSGGEGGGNAVLVIFLVLFILVSIGLGVAYWTGQQTVTDAAAAKKTATDDVNKAKDAQELAELKHKLYKAFVGTATEDEKAAVQSPGKHAEALKDEHERLMAAISGPKGIITTSQNDVRAKPDGKAIEAANTGLFTITEQEIFQWPWPAAGSDKVLAKQPSPGPLLDRMVKIVAERERMFHESNLAKKNADSDAAQYKAEKDKYTTALTAAKKQVDDQIKALNDAITAVETAKKDAIDTFVKKGDDANKGIAVKAREVDEKQTQLNEAKDQLANALRQLESVLSQKTAAEQERSGVFPVNVPHGEIVSRKPGSPAVEISIGSDAGLRPGQTFTVQPLSAAATG